MKHRTTTIVSLLILSAATLAAILAASCSGYSSATTESATASGSTQASYKRLDIADDSAWNAAVEAGKVRQGSILVKTRTSLDPELVSELGATEAGSFQARGYTWSRLALAEGSERSAIASLREAAGVLIAEPENILAIPEGERGSSISKNVETESKALGDASVLDDPYVSSAEYSLTIADAIDAYRAGAYPLDGSEIAYAAVLDTGINLEHEDFLDSEGASIVVLAKSAFTKNGSASYTYIGDTKPFVEVGSGENWDDDGHGSHVAGIMGAVGNNGVGTAGVMWKGLKLISYKVLTDYESVALGASSGSGSDWAVYGALKELADWWAVSTNHEDTAQVTLPVNLSLGSSYASSFEIEMIAYALERKVLVFAAMGNDGRTTVEYPAAYSGVVAVGATDGMDERAEFSTTGTWMSVCAPGFDIISTFNGSSSDYEWESGSSMATPFVTGLAAYLLAYAPNLEPDQVKTVLEESADLVGEATGYTKEFGYGRVNVKKALELATGSSLPASGSVYSGALFTIRVTLTNATTATTSALDGQKVYLYTSSGDFVEVGISDSEGEVSFTLLARGTYTAKAGYGGTTKSASFTVAGGADEADASATIAF